MGRILSLGAIVFLTAQVSFAQTQPLQIIAKIKSAYSQQDFQALAAYAQAAGMDLQQNWQDMGMTLWNVTDEEIQTLQQLLILAEQMQYDLPDDLEFAEPNYIMNDAPVAGQAYTESQVQGVVTPGQQSQTGAPIGSTQVWSALSSGKAKPIVAIIDSGLDMSHPVFVNSGAIWRNSREIAGNGVDDDGNGYRDDVNGWNFAAKTNNPQDDESHGTHVAGIILGAGQDIFLRPIQQAKIQIMPLKFLTANGSGATSDAVDAIRYAVNNGAAVINNSWGGPNYSKALKDALGYASNRKVIVVNSAGNETKNIDSQPNYPAAYTDIASSLAVAATNDSDAIASFSNYGASKVEIGGPGVGILSTIPGNQFARKSGTSMAAPFVAGAAILMKYERPEMSGYQIKRILLDKSDNVPGLNGYVNGINRLHVLKSVNEAKVATLSDDTPVYSEDLSSNGGGNSGGGGGCGTITTNHRKGPPGFFMALLVLPLLFVAILRRRTELFGRQAVERYS